MTKINLRDYYPDFYTADCIIEVPDEVAVLMDSSERAEVAYYLRTYRHKAFYSLDRSDGIENDILFISTSPCEIYERKGDHRAASRRHLCIARQAGQVHLCAFLFRYKPN